MATLLLLQYIQQAINRITLTPLKDHLKIATKLGEQYLDNLFFALLVLLMYTSINFPGACICGISFYTLGTLWQKEQ